MYKVLELGKFFPIKGGVEKVMYDIFTGITDARFSCDMMCATRDTRQPFASVVGEGSLYCCPAVAEMASTMISPSMVQELWKRCRDYDIIHVHHPDPMAALALRLSGYRGKVVLHWHSDIRKPGWMMQAYLPLQTWLINRADVIVGTSPVYLASSPYLKDVQSKTICIPIGIDPIRPQREKVEAIRQKYKGRKIVFSLGRLVHYKGFRYLINAARHLSNDYLVLIGGAGLLKDELETQIKTNHLEDKVKLIGRVADADLPAYYGACTLFCLSSIMKTEAFGIVQIEAMSCGKPVVATQIPGSGVAWVNEQGVSGVNVQPEDAVQLAEGIRAVSENEEVYKAYSLGAFKRFNELFTKGKMINSITNTYLKLL